MNKVFKIMTNYIVIMLEDYYFYFLATTAVLTGAFGAYYYQNGTGARRLVSRMGWEAVKAVVRFRRLGADIAASFREIGSGEGEDTEEEGEDVVPDTLIYYKREEANCYRTDSLEPSDLESQDFEGASIAFVRRVDGESNLYKRINTSQLEKTEYDSLTMEKVPKQFLQVELMDLSANSEAMDIHHSLGEFYVYGNKILDSAFLEWYLQTYYSVDLPETYSLKIFDKDVNQLTMERGDVIVLLEGVPAYALMKDKDLRIEEDETTDQEPVKPEHEGATDE